MNNLGYARVAAAVPEVRPGDVGFNVESTLSLLKKGAAEGAEIIVFPELGITGYTCADLFYQQNLLDAAIAGIEKISEATRNISTVAIVGCPVKAGNTLFNCAAVIAEGEIKAFVPKTHLPNYNEFYEKRWFASSYDISVGSVRIGKNDIPIVVCGVFEAYGIRFGIEICEDLWVPAPPSAQLSLLGADIIFNLSASDEQAGKHAYLRELVSRQSAACRCGYVYASAGMGESSTDLVFSGNAIIAENGTILGESERFSLSPSLLIRDIDIELLRNDRQRFSSFSDDSAKIALSIPESERNIIITKPCKPGTFNPEDFLRRISPSPFTDGSAHLFKERCEEISSIQAWGLAQRLRAINAKNAVIGISGGLDSTLALLVTVKAFDMLKLDRKGITAITMPGFGTTGRTHSNATELMELLGVTALEIPIGEAVELHFRQIGHDPKVLDATYENSQARERTQILMDMANKTGGIVIGTGDLSELALGWCTYNGDQMSMYGVNASVPKTLVKYLVKGYAENSESKEISRVLLDIIDTPISPELLPAASDDSIKQKTEDLVGPYELHDFFIYNVLRNSFAPTKIYRLALVAFKGRYDAATIRHWLKTFYRRFFSQQFKRSCMPDGVKVGSVCLSPRGDWRMPSDASSRLWIEEVEKIED